MRGPALLAALTLATLALSAACAREGDRLEAGPPTVGSPGPDTVTGRVRQVGNAPFVRTLVQGEEEAVAVTGEYELELARLTGATVRVTGERSRGGLGPELRASSYAILSIDGEIPRVGILRRDDEGYRLERVEGGSISLRSIPEGFARLVEWRIWVVIEEGAVTRHGLLREPEEDVREPEEAREP